MFAQHLVIVHADNRDVLWHTHSSHATSLHHVQSPIIERYEYATGLRTGYQPFSQFRNIVRRPTRTPVDICRESMRL